MKKHYIIRESRCQYLWSFYGNEIDTAFACTSSGKST